MPLISTDPLPHQSLATLSVLEVALDEHLVLEPLLGELRAGSGSSSSSCVPRSTIRPASITTISSASEIVESR